MKHYLFDSNAVLEEVKSCDNGLSQSEADARLEQNGKNKLAEGKKISMVQRFFMQLVNPMIIVLIIAALISLITTLIPVMTGKGHFDIICVEEVLHHWCCSLERSSWRCARGQSRKGN